MNATYVLRDARISEIDALLPFLQLPPDAAPAEVALFGHRETLRADRWQVEDRTFLLVADDWLWGFLDPDELVNAVAADPVYEAGGSGPLLSLAQAQAAIVRPANMLIPKPANYLDLVRTALGHDQATFDQVLQAAHWNWLTSNPSARFHPYDDVCVLLPVRLETIFDAPDPDSADQRWKLAIRVMPDEASILRDSRYLSAAERVWLGDFWASVFDPDLAPYQCVDSARADIPWKLLADRVSPERAAWLVSIPVDFSSGQPVLDPPENYPETANPNRIGGMPAELWIKADVSIPGQNPSTITIGRLPEQQGRFIDTDLLTMPFPSSSDAMDDHWLTSFARAREIGLGGWYVLPDGVDPDTITTLYVVGSGDSGTEPHIRALIDSGDLQMIRPGTPTNVGKDAQLPTSPDPNWRAIASQRLRPLSEPAPSIPGAAAKSVATALTGSDSALPSFPGGTLADDCALSNEMVSALWPALWGHALRDIWQLDNNAYFIGRWMQERFCPLGPLMPVRIADQPYGLLPAIDLTRWEPDDPADPDESSIFQLLGNGLPAMLEARDLVANARLDTGNIVGKSTSDYMTALGRPSLSHSFAVRWFAPPEAWMTPSNPSSADVDEAKQHAEQMYAFVRDRLSALPSPEPYVTSGYWWPNDLPLVQPNRAMCLYLERENHGHFPLDSFLEQAYGLQVVDLDTLFSEEIWWFTPDSEHHLSTLPDSLLARLLVYSFQLVESWTMASFGTNIEGAVLDRQRSAARSIARMVDRPEWTRPLVDPVSGSTYFAPEIDPATRVDVERGLRATLDSAAHRSDPWLTAFAWDRLLRNTTSDRSLHRLGVYGWVDGPFKGRPGPTDAGVLHTPSQAQTAAALILRDNFLSKSSAALQSEQNANPWQLGITSSKARLAREIAEDVRFGFHIYEVLGRMVEEVIDDHQVVRQLRTTAYGMRPERKDPSEVLNGLVALNGLLGDSPLVLLSEEQLDNLRVIRDALDTYADLLVADGVMQLLDRQVDRAAETMDAAAGFSRPPTFEFLQTPPSGYQLDTAVVSLLPYIEPPAPGASAHPVELADASVAAFIETLYAGPWRWSGREAAGEPVLDSVTLAQLGLSVLDALTLGADFLDLLARTILDPRCLVVDSPPEHRAVQHLVSTLGSRPAIGADLIAHTDRATTTSRQLAVDTAIYSDLLFRYTALVESCTLLADQLESAGDDATRVSLLRRALPWGAIPASQPEHRNALVGALLGRAPADPAAALTELCDAAASTLRARLPTGAPPTAAQIGALLADEVERKKAGIPEGIPSLTQAIGALAAPNARLAVTATWTTATFVTETGIDENSTDATLDEIWLTVVAAPRAALARLEAVQLDSDQPLQSWTSAPGNPWRAGDDPIPKSNIVGRNLRQRETSVAGLETPRFVAAYGVGGAWDGERVAVGLIDSFGEAIPLPQRSTSVAFGFNAPASRPPQAILLGVPSEPGAFLDNEAVFGIVRETRKNALARAARCEEMGELQAVVPSSWLQASGTTRARLEPWPLYEKV